MAGVYIHLPYCARRCFYCSFLSGAPHDSMKLYVAALKREIAERLKGEVGTVYIGGGTPSVMYRGAIADILSFIRAHCKLEKNAEITVECNPDSVTKEFVDEITETGVNRVSIGLQTDNDELLKRINRPHDLKGFLNAWELLSHVKNKSVDLMLGLPGQTQADLKSSLNLVTGLNAPHISLYALKVEEGTPLYETGFIEDEDGEADMYELAYKFLIDKGYNRYEVSNFCLGDNYSRHNFGYWDMTQYYGFGASAHSFIDGKRIANTYNVNKYILGDYERETVDVTKDRAEEYIMLSLRTSKGIDLTRLRSYGVDLLSQKKKQVEEFIKSGTLILNGDRLYLSNGAYYVMNSVISSLI